LLGSKTGIEITARSYTSEKWIIFDEFEIIQLVFPTLAVDSPNDE
jgi:hypothetical protein